MHCDVYYINNGLNANWPNVVNGNLESAFHACAYDNNVFED